MKQKLTRFGFYRRRLWSFRWIWYPVTPVGTKDLTIGLPGFGIIMRFGKCHPASGYQ